VGAGGGTPTSNNGTISGSSNTPTGDAGTPTNEGGTPTNEGGTPGGDNGNVNGGGGTPTGGNGNVTGKGNVTGSKNTPKGSTAAPKNNSSFLSFNGVSLAQVLYNLELYAWIIFATVAIIVFVFAGVLFISAQGDAEKLKTAKRAFVWGIIGAVLAILSYAIRAILANVFHLG